MKKDNLLAQYQKSLKKTANKSKNYHYNYFTNLLLRFFLSSLILLGLILTNKITLKKNNEKLASTIITKNGNFLSLVEAFNGLFGQFIIIKDDLNVSTTYPLEEIKYENGCHFFENETNDMAVNFVSGVVIKIIKEKGLYQVTIQNDDNYCFEYGNLQSFDYHLYSYLNSGTIMGLAKFNNGLYQYTLKITKDGKNYALEEFNKN